MKRGLGVCRQVSGRQHLGQVNEAQRVLRQSLTLVGGLKGLEPPVEDADLEILASGEEALRSLIQICQRIGQGRGARRARETQRVLQRAMTLVAELGGVVPSGDSDLVSEETRNEMFRRKREEARRQAREEARRGI